MVWHESLAKEFEDTYEGSHELQGFGLGRGGAKNRHWAGAKKQMLGWTEARGWAGQRPEVGLDRGQRLGWTEAPRLLVTFVTSFISSIWAVGAGQDRVG
jgi:hypothetical protein